MPFFCTEDHASLYFEDKGQGKPIVFIHGWSCSRHHFSKQVNELKESYRVISYDLRGHGDSERVEHGLTMEQFAKDLKDLVNYLELEDVSFVGWSMGTHIIWEYVKQYGCDNVSNLCFIDMTPKLLTDEEWKLGLFGDFGHEKNLLTLASICKDWDAHVSAFTPGIFAPTFDDPNLLEWMIKEAKRNTPHVMVNMWIAMAIQDYREVLPQITVPCLITYGTKSFYSKENSEYIESKVPQSKLVEFEHCGHALHLEDTAKFNHELAQFIG
ncbi:pimeloyl-ACP methyl ester carboxylesterase [Oikeobacillus pervagus]|uniref:Pimeloyl-ACP methyl ester carboxylesterase n=1 Tax=Oikeobacillus pervagus TaxID=1325931 RepID=A0AAJ1T027_9BACI|nr:alpha/beta hydrolase [Oikeobacillus pervagus]MDQ0216034.1 pimeloyl-ACP methyl ester carboxylesterase [Oikeobacillus pervagus]